MTYKTSAFGAGSTAPPTWCRARTRSQLPELSETRQRRGHDDESTTREVVDGAGRHGARGAHVARGGLRGRRLRHAALATGLTAARPGRERGRRRGRGRRRRRRDGRRLLGDDHRFREHHDHHRRLDLREHDDLHRLEHGVEHGRELEQLERRWRHLDHALQRALRAERHVDVQRGRRLPHGLEGRLHLRDHQDELLQRLRQRRLDHAGFERELVAARRSEPVVSVRLARGQHPKYPGHCPSSTDVQNLKTWLATGAPDN